ncbi:MAG TPA: hypothetical protein VF381_10900 [Thermoanaerobaculia bacterium]
MSFYVEKKLATGAFRFIVARRRELTSIDDNPEMSTGESGEFVRHREEMFYVADHRPIRKPELPQPRSIAAQPFWTSLVDGTLKGWGFLAMIVVGVLFILLGFSVVLSKGPQGWMLVLLGLALIIVPVILTANKRRIVRAAEDRRRSERAERDKRDRELLAAYAATLDTMRDDPSDASLDAVRREREKLDLPYSIWGDAACSSVLQVGFRLLARVGPDRANEVAALMDRASRAAGLVDEDAIAAKHAIYATVLWHYIADDRLGTAQLRVVRAVESGLGIAPEDVPIETSSEAQFERLRGIDHRNVPHMQTAIPLQHREYGIHTVSAAVNGAAPANVHLTNKRLIVEGAKKQECSVPTIDDIDVDADTSTVTLRIANLKTPIALHVEEPVYFASLISLATTLDERPKSFM